ncbi:2249_t:CDS:1 [Funneliformis caledonium]|uniref:2249_t:CDS:1 n=1 Tax=Funneliformis caledonium TaxID=1117310 RepID=A0A9N9E6M2_9GLOM|nr:2249_t:CDS:1 [Funneliformis caledonium]
MSKEFILVTLLLTLSLAWFAHSTPAQNYLEHCSGATIKESTKNVVYFSKPSSQKFVTIKGSTDEIDYYSPSQPSIQKLENIGESTDEIDFSPSHPSIQKLEKSTDGIGYSPSDCYYCGGYTPSQCSSLCYYKGYRYYACLTCYCYCTNG